MFPNVRSERGLKFVLNHCVINFDLIFFLPTVDGYAIRERILWPMRFKN